MAPALPVLIGLDDATAAGAAVRSRLERAVRSYGLESRFCRDGREALALAQDAPLAATLVDAEWALDEGEQVWRIAIRHLRQRLVLMTPLAMTPEARQDLWFEALQQGAAAVLPLPPAVGSVRLALDAALRGQQTRDTTLRGRPGSDDITQDFNRGSGEPPPRRW